MNNFHTLCGKTIVFIGGGNMANAIIDGLLLANQTHHLGLVIQVSDPDITKRDAFAQKGVEMVLLSDAPKILTAADIVVLAIKPQVVESVAEDIAPYIADKLIVSILAGVSTQRLSELFNSDTIVRCMPNLPASIGVGATGLFAFNKVSAEYKAQAAAILQSCGIAVWVNDETLLHVVTAVSGSSPAYFFYMLEAMVEKAVQLGLDEQTAKLLAVQSLIGAGFLAKDDDLAVLRQKVTSKGGTTQAAIDAFEAQNFAKIVDNAMQACVNRSQELAK